MRRELAFSLLVDDEGRPSPAGETLLQGKIDLLVEDEAGWLVVDFKTDHVDADECSEAARAYAGQVAIYKTAVRAIVGAPDVAAMLVFLHPGTLVQA